MSLFFFTLHMNMTITLIINKVMNNDRRWYETLVMENVREF